MRTAVRLALLPALLLAAARSPGGEAKPRISAINYQKLTDDFATGGQPSLEDLARLKADGIKTIVNLREPSEHDAKAEQARAEELGLRYINVPVKTEAPRPESVQPILDALADPANRPVYLHCGVANRVGAFWLIHRVIDDGWPAADAEAEARRIGLKSPNLVTFAHDYIKAAARPGTPASK